MSNTVIPSTIESVAGVLLTNSSSNSSDVDLDQIIKTLNDSKFQRLIPAVVYTSLLLVIGVPGNAIVWIVYYSKWRRSSTRIFILVLATLDLLNCFLSLPVEIYMMFNYFIFTNGTLCKLSRFTTYTCNSSATMTLIAIAVDRYQRICKPHQNVMATRTAKLVSFLTVIIAILTMWPSLVIYGIQHIETNGIYIAMCLIEDRYVPTKYPLAFFTFNCICTFINFLTLIVLYSFVGVKVCKRWRFKSTSVRSLSSVMADDDDCPETESFRKKEQHQPETNGQHSNQPTSPGGIRLVFMNAATTLKKTKESCSNKRVIRIGKTTLMLFLVTLVYILSFLPFLVMAVYRSIHPAAFRHLDKPSEMVYNVFLRSYLFNCAINPVIYSFCNDLFRKECSKLFKQIVCFKRKYCR